MHELFSGVHQQKAAGAVGVFGFSAFEASLADERGLLVAENAGNGNTGKRTVRDLAVDLAARTNARQHLRGNAE